MSLPPLNNEGDLPVGVHRAPLDEVLAQFGCGTAQRVAAGDRLARIYRIAKGTGKLARFIVFGSFVTDKPEPNDVDIFLIMEDGFDAGLLIGEAALLFDHHAADTHFGASVFWIRRLAALGGEQAAVEYWQIKRGGGERGILEVIGTPS